MGTSFFSVQNMCIFCVLYRLYILIQKLIKFPTQFCFLQSQFCFLHGIRTLVFLRAFSVQPSSLGPFLCSLHCCTQPSFLGISVQSSLLHLTFFQPFIKLLCVSFFPTSPVFSLLYHIFQPSFLVSSPKDSGDSSL